MKKGSKSIFRNLYLVATIASAAFTCLMAVSLLWNLHRERDVTLALAKKEAVASFTKDLAFRHWAAQHGGVYVPVTEETQPNPYLSGVNERDIVTPSGRRLTLMNPAYVIRQAIAHYRSLYGVNGHITSLKLLNPGNAPDEWERSCLQAFDRGLQEAVTVTGEPGAPYLRFMRPMITEESCLKCHAFQGYHTGDIRGGISVSVPLQPYFAIERNAAGMLGGSHAAIWLLGMSGIGLVFSSSRKGILAREKTEEARHKDAEALRNSQKLLAEAEQLAHAGSWELDPRADTLVWSDEVYRIFGLAPHQFGATFAAFLEAVHPDDRAFVDHAYAESVRAGTRYDIVHRIINRSTQETRWVHEVCEHHRDASGTIVRSVGVVQDVTERRRLEEQLRQAQKMEAIGLLAGGVAHDFNNMLMAIMGYANLIQMALPEGDPLREDTDELLKATDKAAGLTQSLLAFGRKQTFTLRPLNLNDVIRKVEKLLGRIIGEDVEVQVRCGVDPLAVSADSGQIEQVLMNMATNARDAMPGGGVFSVASDSVAIDGEQARRLGLGQSGTYALVTVSDTGTGMDAATREKLFEPFFTTKEVGKGTGLGLSIVYGIIKQHGGCVNVYSEPGKGTTFKVYLPVTQARIQADNATAPQKPVGGNGTILLAEDEPGIRSLTRKVLTDFGYTIIEAADGAEAIARFIEHRQSISLLLFDLVMPKKNGKEAYEEIRKMRDGIPVLFMSGYPRDAARNLHMLAGNAELVMKPLSPLTLLTRISAILGTPAPP